jgi:malonate transporter
MILRVVARQPLAELWNMAFFGALSAIAVFGLLLGLVFAQKLLRLPYLDAVSRGQGFIACNFTFLGIPLMLAFLGEAAAGPIAIAVIIDGAVVLPFAYGLLEAARGGGSFATSVWNLVRGTFFNPFMLSILGGVLLSLGQVPIPEPIDRFLGFLGPAAAPAGIFALGLATRQWSRGGWPVGAILPLVTGKLILHPLIVFLVIAYVLRLDPFWVKAGVLYSALPMGANVFLLAERAGGDARVIALSVVASTALAALTFPIAGWLVTLWAGG